MSVWLSPSAVQLLWHVIYGWSAVWLLCHVTCHVSAMHRQFQHDLYRLRLETARHYVRVLQKSLSPITSSPAEPLKLSAQVGHLMSLMTSIYVGHLMSLMTYVSVGHLMLLLTFIHVGHLMSPVVVRWRHCPGCSSWLNDLSLDADQFNRGFSWAQVVVI